MKQAGWSLVLVAVLAVGVITEAQPPKKISRIAYVDASGTPNAPERPFKLLDAGLRELGYTDGQNIVIERRYASGHLDKIPTLVNELLQQKPDVFVAFHNVDIRAAQKATKEIPIVIASSIDPVAAGYVKSLAHPGGNLTGVSILNRELSAKRVELLKEIFPKLSRLAILWDTDGPGPKVAFKEYEAAAFAFKVNIQALGIHGPNPDLERAFHNLAGHTDAIIIVTNPLIRTYKKQIIEMVTRHRIPSMVEGAEYVDIGGLLFYGTDVDIYKRAAVQVDKILKGAKPADLPVEQPTKFGFIVNLKAAKQIGVTVPPNVLVRADRVIK